MDYKQLYEKAISIQSKAMNGIYKDIKEYAFVFVYPPPQTLYSISQSNLSKGNERDISNDLKDKGLKDPVYDLRINLVKHPGLIPVRGILGGTMKFDDRFLILTNRWILAGFGDGHYGGYMLLQYEINKSKIEWKVLATVYPAH